MAVVGTQVDTMVVVGTQGGTMAAEGTQADIMAVVGTRRLATYSGSAVLFRVVRRVGVWDIPVYWWILGTMLIRVGGGPPYVYPYSYYYPNLYSYYPYPILQSYDMSPPEVTVEPPAYSQQQEQPYYWYYCQNPQGYYPYVKSCPGGWTQVEPKPTPPNP
jgi:hypothetical protein